MKSWGLMSQKTRKVRSKALGLVAVLRVDPLHDGGESFGFVLGQWPMRTPYGDPAGLDALPLSDDVSHWISWIGFA